jgi:hypothetical protein
MSQCLDCEDKARAKNKQLDEFRLIKINEPYAICITPEGYEFKTVQEAIIQQSAIKEIVFPKNDNKLL